MTDSTNRDPVIQSIPYSALGLGFYLMDSVGVARQTPATKWTGGPGGGVKVEDFGGRHRLSIPWI